MRGSVTVTMAAPPRVVWDLISDVTRIGEFSPETFEAEWLDGAGRPELGARFRGHVRRNGIGPVYWTTCKVTECDPDRVFAFGVYGGGVLANSWRYELHPVSDAGTSGTSVTESFELGEAWPMRLYGSVLGAGRKRVNERGMQETLLRIKAVAERTT